jgi:hypothetical protein
MIRKHAARLGGPEFRARLHGAVDARQRLADQGLQLQGALRRRHALGRTHQQRVVEQRAQAAQAVAHCRLRQVQLLCRLGDTALAQQCVQVDQQVEIDLVQVHAAYPRRAKGQYREGVRVLPRPYTLAPRPSDPVR